jgi:hypothetical protein
MMTTTEDRVEAVKDRKIRVKANSRDGRCVSLQPEVQTYSGWLAGLLGLRLMLQGKQTQTLGVISRTGHKLT